jgi:hypothetical protein
MRSSHAIATWLFERLGLDDALAGDLLEECKRRRSAIWYWKQVLVAVWISIWGAIRDHKVLALRAVATGFAMEYFFLFLWYRFSPLLPDWPILSFECVIFNFSLMLLLQGTTGWVVARTHRAHEVPMVFVFLICVLLWWEHRFFGSARMTLIAAIDQPESRPYLVRIFLIWHLAYTVMLVVGVVVGGIFGSRPNIQRSAPADPKPA